MKLAHGIIALSLFSAAIAPANAAAVLSDQLDPTLRGYMWMQVAAMRGSESAAGLRDAIAERLSDAEIALGNTQALAKVRELASLDKIDSTVADTAD